MQHKYLTFSEALEKSSLSRYQFLDLIAREVFTPCFLCDIKLSKTVVLHENYGIEPNDTREGYIPFLGYITFPDARKYFDVYGGVKEIEITVNKVIIYENLSEKNNVYYHEYEVVLDHETGMAHQFEYEASHSSPVKKDEKYFISFLKDKKNFIVNSQECVFPVSEITRYLDETNSNSARQEVNFSSKSMSDKEKFELVIPLLIRYMRFKYGIEVDVGSKSGMEGGIKKKVLDYVKDKQNGLQFLEKNFANNWREIIKTPKKGSDLTRLAEIFEEKLN